MFVFIEQLLAPGLLHLLIGYAHIVHNCICWYVTRASGDVEDTGAGRELHAEACTCAPLNVELSRDLVVGILLCIHTGLQPHDRVEGVLAA